MNKPEYYDFKDDLAYFLNYSIECKELFEWTIAQVSTFER
jgi:hypothetical protein